MKHLFLVVAFGFAALVLAPARVHAQQQQPQEPNVPAAARQAEAEIEEAVRRFRVGVKGGVGLDPELIAVGAHGAFGPLFRRGVEFRPGVELGLGEVTTAFGINLDVLYVLPGATPQTRWVPYFGAGPNFWLSHRSFESDDEDQGDLDVEVDGVDVNVDPDEDRSRFDFSDTDFKAGFNFIAGARSQGGAFFELAASAWGVSNVRLLIGFNF